MNKKLIIGAVLIVSSLTTNAIAQEKSSIEVKKEVIVEDENGEMKLIIKTTSGTVSKEEVYTGEEAKTKLAELEKSTEPMQTPTTEYSEEISINEIDGQRELRIKTINGDVVKEEVYTGEEAEMKIKELEGSRTFQTAEKKIEKRKIVNAVE